MKSTIGFISLQKSDLAGKPVNKAIAIGPGDKLFVWLLALSTFFPYLGLHLGQSTSIPLTSILSLLVLPRVLYSPPMAFYVLLLMFGPWVATFLSVATGLAQASTAALAAWSLVVSAGFGFLYAGSKFPFLLHRPLRVGLLITSLYAVVQKFFFLDAGTIPFIEYYSSPNYADVQVRAEIITQYIKRPFAFFPEPAFMAGTLAIAAVAMILTRRVDSGTTLSAFDWMTLAAVSGAILLSASGSALISLVIIWLVAIWPSLKASGRLTFLVLAGAGMYFVSITVLTTRNASHNWSWDDRSSSILAGLRFLFSEPLTMFLGVGKGNSTVLFSNGSIPMDGLDYYTYLPDMYSAAGRLLFESGLVIGGTMLLIMLASIYVGVRTSLGTLPAAGSAILWVAVAGLTISYESAAWLWGLPALSFGIMHYQKTAKMKPSDIERKLF